MYDLAIKNKKNPLKIDKEFMKFLPKSIFSNLSDHKFFEDFIDADLEMEIDRAVKFQIL